MKRGLLVVALVAVFVIVSCTEGDLAGEAVATLNNGEITMPLYSPRYVDFTPYPPVYVAAGSPAADFQLYRDTTKFTVSYIGGARLNIGGNFGIPTNYDEISYNSCFYGNLIATNAYFYDGKAICIRDGGSQYVKLKNVLNEKILYEYLYPPPVCGDGVVGGTEQCDDGNTINTDGCSNSCTLPACGDSIVAGAEQCDDGNTVNNDACSNSCNIPTCTDGISNQGETGVDCGSPCGPCAFCGDGIVNQPSEQCDDGNTINTDACSNSCATPTCIDGVQNGVETGVDCGGSCPVCPTCTDGIKNQNEGDIDCGGVCTAENKFCEDGLTCLAAGDCGSRVCTGGICAVPSCTDSVMNGAEKGVDCGLACNVRCVFPCTFTIASPDVRCPVSSPFDRRVSVVSRTVVGAEEFTTEIVKKPADENYQFFFAYKKGYILRANGIWQEFAFTFAGPNVDLFDNNDANLVWFDITGAEDLAAQAQLTFPVGEIYKSADGSRYIVSFVCGCPVGVDCRIQNLWECNSFEGGIFANGAWVVTSVVPD